MHQEQLMEIQEFKLKNKGLEAFTGRFKLYTISLLSEVAGKRRSPTSSAAAFRCNGRLLLLLLALPLTLLCPTIHGEEEEEGAEEASSWWR